MEYVDRHLSSSNRGANLEEEEWSVISIDGRGSLGTFLTIANTLGVSYGAILDYDSLMEISTSINGASRGRQTRTSSAFQSLQRANLLSTEEREVLEEFEPKIANSHEAWWYSPECLEKLWGIARSHHIFTWKTDLEGALRSHTTREQSKPLRALDAVVEMAKKDSLPVEFGDMVSFITERVKGSR